MDKEIIENESKTGRPEAKIDWNKVDRMLEAHCSTVDIAEAFAVCPTTLRNHVEKEFEMSFTDYAQSKKMKGKCSIRLLQYEKAESGDNTMLIWLGKQWLEQKEKHENDNLPPNDAALNVSFAFMKENIQLKKEMDQLIIERDALLNKSLGNSEILPNQVQEILEVNDPIS